MNLKKVLTKECVLPNLQGGTKEDVIRELIAFLAQAGKLPDPEAALRAVLDREAKMSTGMQYGIAIPHGKTDRVNQLVAAVAIHRNGVDFQAMDGLPSHIFIMTVSPENRTGPHIQFLAEVSKVLSRPELREQLLQADSADQILRLLAG